MGNPFERQWNPKSTRAMLTLGPMAAAALSIAIAYGGGTRTALSSGAVATFAVGCEHLSRVAETRF